jgi:hypothetical protein
MRRVTRIALVASIVSAACTGSELTRSQAAEMLTKEFRQSLERQCQLSDSLARKPEFAELKGRPVCTASISVTGIRKDSETQSTAEASLLLKPSTHSAEWMARYDSLTERARGFQPVFGYANAGLLRVWTFTDTADGQRLVGSADEGRGPDVFSTPQWKAFATLSARMRTMLDSGRLTDPLPPFTFRLYDDGWRLVRAER